MRKAAWLLVGPLVFAGLLAFGLSRVAQAAPALTFTVNTPFDENDDNTADNACHTASAHCSLRAAVQQANNTNNVVIHLPPGTYILTDSVHGDLSLNNSMVISGSGAANTVIEGEPGIWQFRIVHVSSGNDVSIKGVTLRYGNSVNDGGGISNAGDLTLSDSVVYSNTSAGVGAGIFNSRSGGTARLTLLNSSVIANRLTYTFTPGGAGIYNDDVLTLTNSSLLSNTTGTTFGYGGGLVVAANGSAVLSRTLVAGNTAFLGGGLSVLPDGTLNASQSTISANHAITGAGGGIDNGGVIGLYGVTVTNNIAVAGAGIENHDGAQASVLLGAILSNSASSGAGIQNIYTSTLLVASASIESNVASYAGGGIYNDNTSKVTILLGEVSNNSAPGTGVGGSGNGGGIYAEGAGVLINGTHIEGNSAFNGGGGVSAGPNLTITAATIVNNSAAAGGGVSTYGRFIINQSVISGNTAIEGAGLFALGLFTDHANISNTTFSRNVSDFRGGGGIYAANLHLWLSDDTLSDNQTKGDGGGIYNDAAFWRLVNVTIAGNRADSDQNGDGDGGGIFNSPSGRAIDVNNSLVAGNSDGGGQAPDCRGELSSLVYSLLQNTSGCVYTNTLSNSLTGMDPLLGPLQDNGGPTPTRALSLVSPAVDTGSPDPQGGSYPCAPADQRGVSRPQGSRCDMGAYEGPAVHREYLPVIRR